jgi:cadherin EGF LAG seven-pass G-type receptor 1
MRKSKANPNEGSRKDKRTRRESMSDAESDANSLELASSHSSDDDESRIGRNSSAAHRSVGVSSSYLPNITEHSSPPELNVIQNPQLFPNVSNSRWMMPERWSQETTSDNEMLHQKQILKSPDLTGKLKKYANYVQNTYNSSLFIFLLL